MALTTCPDCGKEISTAATACPHCGRPQVVYQRVPTYAHIEKRGKRFDTLYKSGALLLFTGILLTFPAMVSAGKYDTLFLFGKILVFGGLFLAVSARLGKRILLK